MNTIGARYLDQCFLKVIYRFRVAALRHSHLSEPVVSSRIVLIDLQCRAKTLTRIFQTVQFQKDVSEVHERCNIVRPQRARGLITPYGVVETSLLLVQLSQ